MTVGITRRGLDADGLRREAARCRDARATRWMLALALVLEGHSREEAARAGGMDRRTLRDWAHRHDAGGLDALRGGRLGPGPRPAPGQEAGLATVVEHGSDPDRDGVVRRRRADLKALAKARHDVELHERSVGEVPRRPGFARVSVRPRHPKADEAAQAAFRQAPPSWWRRRGPGTPAASRSRPGSGTRPASAGRAP